MFFCGKECRRSPSLIKPTQSLGNGLQMGCTLPSRRMGSNSSGLTAPSILRLSGRQRLRASIVSLDGFYFSKKFRPQTSCWSKEFRVTRCVVSAIKHLKQLLISACIARLLRRFGSWFTLGRGLFSMPPSGVQVQDWWNDAMRLATAHTKPTLAAILLYTVWNIWNERNRRIFQGLMQTPVRIFGLIKQEMAFRQQACEERGTP